MRNLGLTDREIIPIDGKTLRGAKSNGKKSPFHMVSAWASKNNMVLGQVKVSEKYAKLKGQSQEVKKVGTSQKGLS